MTPFILARWLLTITAATLGFLFSLRQKRKLKTPQIFLGYFACAGIVQLACLLTRSGDYQTLFWATDITHNVLLCIISIEVLCHLLPDRRYAFVWTLAAFTILIVRLSHGLPSKAYFVLLNLTVNASFTCGVLLVLLLFIKVDWTQEYSLVSVGIVLLLVSDNVPWIGWVSKALGKLLVSVVQLGPVVGLTLLSIAGADVRILKRILDWNYKSYGKVL
jgi:hypothetical protein